MDLKATINLPRTRFSMKANLPSLEPRILARWEKMGLYEKIQQARRGGESFVLHDGPPYANGHIHQGHALNKILKDLVVKTKTMQGYRSPYVPGWDCHGLPIEIKVAGTRKTGVDPLQVRRECREYASRFVAIQKEEFKRLGVFGDWDQPYLTMSNGYEARIARLFGRFVEQGSVYKGLKPVHWCISCETALAEAEVEYRDHTSPSVYVKFPIRRGLEELDLDLAGRRAFVLTWTTTPWTLPANLAMCFHPDLVYALVGVGDEIFLLARDLVERVAEECGFDGFEILHTLSGEQLTRLASSHPWLDRESTHLLADHVTLEQGTGTVHTAPGHGHEDYAIGAESGLEIYCPVGGDGTFNADVEHFAGLGVFDANSRINGFMRDQGVLVREKEIVHSYPHCWRCHNPVIFRATPQWFIAMEANDLRRRALEEIEKVSWLPTWGQERIASMIAHRPDWCISRQRYWGVPIVVFYCTECREPLLRGEVVDHVAAVFERESADAWYAGGVEELLPPGTTCRCGASSFEKEFDILDVWFDSGSSHDAVLGHSEELPWPADLYLEGSDQYRGWFHSSLLIGVGTHGSSPYRAVICHGFTLDEQGHAMSKSRGNVVSPLDVMKENGAEILRLWVASINYVEDVRLGQEILSRLREAYRKIRNTVRFLLGNLHDFQPGRSVPAGDMEELDRWALARLARVSDRVEQAYRDYEFHTAYHALYNFCVVDLSSFYLDILKDRLYTSAPDSRARRSAQSALFMISDALVRLLAPVLPFTCEEVWTHLHGEDPPLESVHLSRFAAVSDYRDDALLERWQQLREVRSGVSKALEEFRQSGEIGNSLQAAVRLRAGEKLFHYLKGFQTSLRFLFIVSHVDLELDEGLPAWEFQARASRAQGEKCERCWNYRLSVGESRDFPTICSRCRRVLEELAQDQG